MSGKVSVSYPRDALEQARLAHEGWAGIQDDLEVPNLSPDDFVRRIQEATERIELAEQLKTERSKAVENRDLAIKEVWDLTKRIRHAARATFGDNSSEVARVGGARGRRKQDS